jgi:transposase
MGLIAQSQAAWLKANTNCELFFISRQTTNWEEWMIKHFNKDFAFDFNTDKYLYLTCSNEYDDTCWQKIIYSGNTEILKKWKRRSSN